MTADFSGYLMRIFVDSPNSDRGGSGAFSMSGRLRKSGRRPKPGVPLREDSDPVVPEYSLHLLRAFAAQAFAAGFHVRVDVSKAEAGRGPWLRWCQTGQQFAGLLESLLPRPGNPAHDSIYPVAIWFLPRESPKAENLVETFRGLPMDDALFSEVLRGGVFRIALFDAFFDLLADASLTDVITGWMRNAAQATPRARIEWAT